MQMILRLCTVLVFATAPNLWAQERGYTPLQGIDYEIALGRIFPKSQLSAAVRRVITIQIRPPFAPELQVRIEERSARQILVWVDALDVSLSATLDRELQNGRPLPDRLDRVVQVKSTKIEVAEPLVQKWVGELLHASQQYLESQLNNFGKGRTESVLILLDPTLYNLVVETESGGTELRLSGSNMQSVREGASADALVKAIVSIVDACLPSAKRKK